MFKKMYKSCEAFSDVEIRCKNLKLNLKVINLLNFLEKFFSRNKPNKKITIKKFKLNIKALVYYIKNIPEPRAMFKF